MLKGHGGNLREAAMRSGLKAEEILDFSVSVNHFAPSGRHREFIEESLAAIPRYPDPEYAALRGKIAARYGIPPSTVIVGNGSTELLYLIPRALGLKTALVISPAYADYADAVTLAGGKVERFFTSADDGFAINFSKLARRLVEGVDAVFVGNPNNPTGVATAPEQLRQTIRRNPGALFVVDESFADFAPDVSLLRHPEPNLIIIRSLTKFFGIPGLRIGFAAAPEDTVKKLLPHKEPWTVNCVAETFASKMLDGFMNEPSTLARTAEERLCLSGMLSGITGLKAHASSANFLLVRIEAEKKTAAQVQAALLKKGLLIRDCANFAGLDPYFFRVAVRSAEDNRRLADALKGEMEQ